MRTIILIILAVVVATTAPIVAQPLEQQELENFKAEGDEMYKNAEVALHNLTASKKRDCIAAVGAVRLCDCLSHQMPVGLTFPQYAAIVAKTKADLGYDHMDQIARQGIDTARQARDICVAAANNAPSPIEQRWGPFQQVRRQSP